MRRLPTREGYDRWAPTYDDSDPSTELDEPILSALWGDPEGRRALDLGCGTGRYARLLVEAGARAVGLDLSRAMLRRAAADRRLRGAEWVQGSVDALPFRSASFDLVVSGLVLDHLARIDPYFEEIARVLRAGGRSVVATVHPETQRRGGPDVRFVADGEQVRIPGHLHEPERIRTAIVNAGLELTAERAPRFDARTAARRPEWSGRRGRRALLVLAARRPE